MIKAVSFDIDDTLYDFQSVSRRALAIVVSELRTHLGDGAANLDMETVIEDLIAAADVMEQPYARLHALRVSAFNRTLARFGVKDAPLAERMSHLYFDHRRHDGALFEGTRETLAELARDYTLCTVSNGEQDLAQLGLEGVFDVVVFAAEVGYCKPDKRIFAAAAERAGCAMEECVHVGDSLESDVLGALQAGMRAIWFDPWLRTAEEGIRPDAVVRSMSALPEAVLALDYGAS